MEVLMNYKRTVQDFKHCDRRVKTGGWLPQGSTSHLAECVSSSYDGPCACSVPCSAVCLPYSGQLLLCSCAPVPVAHTVVDYCIHRQTLCPHVRTSTVRLRGLALVKESVPWSACACVCLRVGGCHCVRTGGHTGKDPGRPVPCGDHTCRTTYVECLRAIYALEAAEAAKTAKRPANYGTLPVAPCCLGFLLLSS
jgi:hypothetical protein